MNLHFMLPTVDDLLITVVKLLHGPSIPPRDLQLLVQLINLGLSFTFQNSQSCFRAISTLRFVFSELGKISICSSTFVVKVMSLRLKRCEENNPTTRPAIYKKLYMFLRLKLYEDCSDWKSFIDSPHLYSSMCTSKIITPYNFVSKNSRKLLTVSDLAQKLRSGLPKLQAARVSILEIECSSQEGVAL